MSCAERDESRLIEFLEGELPAAEAEDIRVHVGGCPECAATLAGLGATRAAVEGLPVAEPAEAAWQALRADIARRVDRAAAPRGRRLRRLWPVAALPLAAAAALLLVWRASPPVRTPAPPISVAAIADDPSLDAWILEAPVREPNRYGWAAVLLVSVGGRELGGLVELAEARQAGTVQRVDQLMGLSAGEIEQLVAAVEKGTSLEKGASR